MRYTRMNVETFDKLFRIVGNRLIKRSNREPLAPELRLAVTLSFLANGDSILLTAMAYRIGRSTAYAIIKEVCEIIWLLLKSLYISMDRKPETWLGIADEFERTWNFPNFIGALDGKHIQIRAPAYSGSEFHNYKGFFSFVLMAISDANYKFVWVDIGDYGSLNDASIWGESSMKKAVEANALGIPAPRELPRSSIRTNFVLVGDEALPLRTYLMRPYSRRSIETDQQRVFNYRLSRARRVIENAFGILVSRWRVLESALSFKLSTSESVVQATVCLHNFMITEHRNDYLNQDHITPANVANCGPQSTINNHVQPSSQNDDLGALGAIAQRDQLAKYFLTTEGSVAWHWDKI